MTNLRRSFFWAALYLAAIFILGQTDYFGRPIINFASYFYLAVLVGIPATLFFPSISRVSAVVPLTIWAGIYVGMLLFLERGRSSTSESLPVMLLELLLLEAGIWVAHQLATQISHTESVMDELASGAFPHRAQPMDDGGQRVKVEFTRSRRYHRPLSIILLEVDAEPEKRESEIIKNIQHDILDRLTSARIGQLIDDRIRQTDLVLKDRRWDYVILCPETDVPGVVLLAQRIADAVKEKTGLTVLWGTAAFPEEALTFDDLMKKARERLSEGDVIQGLGRQTHAEKEISEV